MKKIILFFAVLLFSGFEAFSQEVQFSPAVVSSGGGSFGNGVVNLSRWRIGQIHVVTLPAEENDLKQAVVNNHIAPVDPVPDWSVSLSPNPVENRLNIRLEMKNRGMYAFEITDLAGRKVMRCKGGIIYPGQVSSLDLSGLTPALYVLKIIPSGKESPRQFKITKQ